MHYIKSGMGGSRNGKSRLDTTETLKRESKKPRRAQGKRAIKEGLGMARAFPRTWR